MTFVTLRAAILTKLQSVSALQFVDDKHHMDLTGYPAATFEPSAHENDFYTNTDNKRLYAFRILVHQEIESGGRDNAIGVLCVAVDAIIAAFDGDVTLGGAVDFLEAIPSGWGEYKSGQGGVKYAEMILKCSKEVTV